MSNENPEQSKAKEQEKPAKKEEQKKLPVQSKEQIIRFAETNLDGRLKVPDALRQITGISFMYSKAVTTIFGLWEKKIGDLTEEEMKRLEDILMNPAKHHIPAWLYNRRLDPPTGQNIHLVGSTLDLSRKMDINEMKKMKTYKGVRHAAGQPVRGQRTRGSFREGGSVGVHKKKEAPKAGGPPKKEGK